MFHLTERARAFTINLALFEKTAEQLAADKIIADKAVADAELEKLKNATHAADVIKRLNDENRQHRERADKAEADATAAKKLIEEAAAKDLAAQNKFEELYNKEKAQREADKAALEAELGKRDAHALMREVRDAAKAAGILDPDFIELPVFNDALKLAKVDGGKVIGADDVVAKMREIKASAFKTVETADEKAKREETERAAQVEKDRVAQLERDNQGRFTGRPVVISDKDGKGIDWSKLDPKEFEQREAELRAANSRS